MELKGKVNSKILNGPGQGHSQVRATCEVVDPAPAKGQEPQRVDVILSIPSTELADAIKMGQEVSVTL